MSRRSTSDIFLESVKLHLNKFSISAIWDSILTNYTGNKYICKHPGFVISGTTIEPNTFQELINSITRCWDSIPNGNSRVLTFPVFYENFATTTGPAKGSPCKQIHHHHLTMVYIYLIKQNKNEIIINYVNPHGKVSAQIATETFFMKELRKHLRNLSQNKLGVKYHIYSGINLQKDDTIGFCIFYSFLIMRGVMDLFIQSQDPIAPNALVTKMITGGIFNQANFNKSVNLKATGKLLMDVISKSKGGGDLTKKITQMYIKEYLSNALKLTKIHTHGIRAKSSGAFVSSYRNDKTNEKFLVKSHILIDNNHREIYMTGLLPTNKNIINAKIISKEGIGNIIMPQLDGNLRSFLSKLTDTDRKTIIHQLISGVKALHRTGIVHGALKLENILVDNSKNQVKIADFHCSGTTQVLPIVCEPIDFYGPEGIPNTIYDWIAADIWRLGYLILSVLTGVTFNTPNDLIKINTNDIQIINGIIYPYNITNLLAINPHNRTLK